MPTITNQSLTLQPVTGGGGVRVTVTYDADFSPVETFLMANGMVVEERIHLVGDDEARSGAGPVWSSPAEAVAPAAGGVRLTRTRQLDVPRAQLQEDPSQPIYRWISWGPGSTPIRYVVGHTPDDDELLARVELTYAGLSPQSVADTAISLLIG